MLQGANIPCTEAAERILHERGIVCVPDFVANAGGVICGSVEYHGGTKSTAFQEIEEKLKENTLAVLDRAKRTKLTPRAAALELAKERVKEAMSYRRAN
jgi:glutamate dehydrogenase (NAD(P)+)